MDITLALGAGGIRGLAHIGVIRSLEKAGFRIKAVAGSSAGGLIGAVYAAGYTSTEIELLLTAIDQKKMFGRKSGDGPSLMGLTGLTNLLLDTLGTKSFTDLKIPLAVTAVDLHKGQEVILYRGQVIQAVLATIAVPGIFPPIQIEDSLLTDGGGLDPVPVSVARWLMPNLPVVAVVVNQSSNPVKHAGFPIPIPGPAPLVETFTKLRLTQALSIFIQSTEITSTMLTELRLQVDHPDVIIRPDVSNINLLDQVSVPDVIALGEQAGDLQQTSLKRAVSWPNRLRRGLNNIIKAEQDSGQKFFI